MADAVYGSLVTTVLEHGEKRNDRTGTGTLATFGETVKYDLSDGKVPLLMTKPVFWRGIVEELLWFLRGSTDAKELASRGVRIWDANSSRAFLDDRNLPGYEEGDIGPSYGFQWKHAGAKYEGCRGDYEGKGVDQINSALEMLASDEHSRRNVVMAWNAADVDQMALPPCHVMFQLWRHGSNGLKIMVVQRSADIGLGVPFNIASYGLLAHMMAHAAGLKATELIHMIGDAHIYNGHADALREQLGRDIPDDTPTVTLNYPTTKPLHEVTFDDITLNNYDLSKIKPLGTKMPMSV